MQEQRSFGVLLKHYRLAAGLSQEALATRASLSARTISDLERDIHNIPHTNTLELLIGALSLSDQQRSMFLASARPEAANFVDAPVHPPTPSLPLPPNILIGREQERSQALTLLRHTATRLLTLTGSGGVGKTRLALQLAQDIAANVADGVVFLELTSIPDAALVPRALAQTLRIHEQANVSCAEQIYMYLRDKHILLVLDNFEHVLDSTPFVAYLLGTCPRLAVLVTSRTPLQIRGEQELSLAPLPLKDATMLFRARAQAIQADQLYAEKEVAAICEQVDCLPLAIELAARHVKVLSLPQLREQLTHRLSLLRHGARDLPPRQQTMKDTIAWSYELLTEQQQRYFRALGIFTGGWTIEAAEAICWHETTTTPGEPIFVIAALVDASLVQVEISIEGKKRFGMLELIREYALEQLHAAGEEEEYRRRHAVYYAHLAETIIAHFGPEQGVRNVQFGLAQELPNARAALQWAEERQKAELGLRLTGFTRLWHVRGQMSEAERWLERMLALDRRAREQGEHTAPLTLRIEKLYGLARTLVRHGKAEHGAEAFAKEALQLAQSIDDQSGMSNAFATLGMIAQANGRFDEAEIFFTKSYTYAKQMNHGGLMSRALFHLAELAKVQQDAARSTTLLEEAFAHAQATGMTWDIPIIKTLLGHVALQQQHCTQAKVYYREALVLYRAFDSPTYIASCLEGFAAMLCTEAHYRQATRLCAAVTTLREYAQVTLSKSEREAFEHTIATAKAALDESTFDEEWTIGTAVTHDQAIDYALSDACT